MPDGWHRAWDDDGQLLDEAEFRDGDGRWFQYHANGRKELEGEYRAGRRHGTWSAWNQDGRLVGKYAFVDGTGVEMKWYADGTKRSACEYEADRKHGKETTWDDTGGVLSVEEYEHGILVVRHEYDDGRVAQSARWAGPAMIELSTYENDIIETTWRALPDGEEVLSFAHGVLKKREVTIGSHSMSLVRDAMLSRPKPGAAYGNIETHQFGNLIISFETTGGRIALVSVQSGATVGQHRRVLIEPRIDIDVGEALDQRFEVVEVRHRSPDGTMITIRLDRGKVGRVTEWRGGRIVRDATLDKPIAVSLRNPLGLIDELINQGVDIDFDEP